MQAFLANQDEIPEVVRLAAQLNIDRVKGHHLWVHFPEMQEQDLRRSPESVARWNATLQKCLSVAAQTRRPNGRPVRLENFNALEFRPQHAVPANAECPFLRREAWVNHAGRFDPCCAPDERRKGLGHFGQVQEKGFLHIWTGAAYQQLTDTYRSHPLCQSCLMRRPVEGRAA